MVCTLKEMAKRDNVPIIQEEAMEYLIAFINKKGIKSILEIGTAIGYSSINMALINNDIRVVTIERDKEYYIKALKNIGDFNLEEQIKVINEDALNCNIIDKFDLIFIDGAKSQYINFFLRYQNNLKKNGYIITDNLNFHGLVDKVDKIESKNLRSLVNKIKKYRCFLKDNKDFQTTFINIGDGLSISKRRN